VAGPPGGHDADMMVHILLALSVVIAFARAGGMLFRLLQQPAVVVSGSPSPVRRQPSLDARPFRVRAMCSTFKLSSLLFSLAMVGCAAGQNTPVVTENLIRSDGVR